MHIKTSHILGGRGFGLALATQSTRTGTKQSKKNETAAGVALVLAAAVSITMRVGHQLLGEEVEGELHLANTSNSNNAAPVLLGKNMAAEQQDLHNTEGQTRPSPELLPPHLLLVDDLLSGPLSSLNPSAPCWSTHPDPKQSLATPSVELLLSYNLFYLAGAAKVVADDVKDKSFWS